MSRFGTLIDAIDEGADIIDAILENESTTLGGLVKFVEAVIQKVEGPAR